MIAHIIRYFVLSTALFSHIISDGSGAYYNKRFSPNSFISSSVNLSFSKNIAYLSFLLSLEKYLRARFIPSISSKVIKAAIGLQSSS
jgi:hypothetical protein